MFLNRIRIAAVVTLLALGALAVVAISARGGEERAGTAAAARQPEVRTEVVRRDVKVRRDSPESAAAAGTGSTASLVAALSRSRNDGQSRSPAPARDDDHGRHGGDDDGFDDHGRHGGDDDGFDDHGGHGGDDHD